MQPFALHSPTRTNLVSPYYLVSWEPLLTTIVLVHWFLFQECLYPANRPTLPCCPILPIEEILAPSSPPKVLPSQRLLDAKRLLSLMRSAGRPPFSGSVPIRGAKRYHMGSHSMLQEISSIVHVDNNPDKGGSGRCTSLSSIHRLARVTAVVRAGYILTFGSSRYIIVHLQLAYSLICTCFEEGVIMLLLYLLK